MNTFIGGAFRRIGAIARRSPLTAADLWQRYNLNQLQMFEGSLNRHGVSLTDFRSILDFGCGQARLTQHLPRLVPKASVYGCDIDEACIKESKRRCPSGHFIVNDVSPPLDFPEEHFDLIWSYSIFTSLSEFGHKAWLKELARTLRPGGVMLHTTHSYEYLRRTKTFSPESLLKYEFPESAEALAQSGGGYYYVPYSPTLPEYGLAIISKQYVTDEWPQITGLSLVDYAEGAIAAYPEGCQDIVMMAKDSTH